MGVPSAPGDAPVDADALAAGLRLGLREGDRVALAVAVAAAGLVLGLREGDRVAVAVVVAAGAPAMGRDVHFRSTQLSSQNTTGEYMKVTSVMPAGQTAGEVHRKANTATFRLPWWEPALVHKGWRAELSITLVAAWSARGVWGGCQHGGVGSRGGRFALTCRDCAHTGVTVDGWRLDIPKPIWHRCPLQHVEHATIHGVRGGHA